MVAMLSENKKIKRQQTFEYVSLGFTMR